MSQRCSNCVFSRPADGLSSNKRVCLNKADSADHLVIVGLEDHCPDYYVSHLAMMRENAGDAKYKGARVIGLTRGMFALVDESDYAELSQYHWYMEKRFHNCYAVRTFRRKQIRMHRHITEPPEGLVVDHIDNDGLNNRRSNLRICTTKQNARNARSHKGTSKYKGVSWYKQRKKWNANIICDGRQKTIGYFENEIDAALAYDEYAKKLFKEYAYLNFPEL